MHFYMLCNKISARHIPGQEAGADEFQTRREDSREGAAAVA